MEQVNPTTIHFPDGGYRETFDCDYTLSPEWHEWIANWRWNAFWSVLSAIAFRTVIDHPPVAMVMTSDDGEILWARSFHDPAWSDPYFIDRRQP